MGQTYDVVGSFGFDVILYGIGTVALLIMPQETELQEITSETTEISEIIQKKGNKNVFPDFTKAFDKAYDWA